MSILSKLERRAFQTLVVDALSSGSVPLDRDYLLDFELPVNRKVSVPQAQRRLVDEWIEELLDAGILIRDPDCVVSGKINLRVNPNHDVNLPMTSILGPSPDMGVRERWATLLLFGVLVALVFVFYTVFLPQDLLVRATGTATLVTALLGGIAVQVQKLHPPAPSRGIWKIVLALTLVVGAMVVTGYALPLRVRAVPGASIFVDGKLYEVVPEDVEHPGKEVWRSLWTSWGTHTVSISREWFLDQQSWQKEASATLSWPWQRVSGARLRAQIHLSADTSLVKGSAAKGKVDPYISLLMRVEQEMLSAISTAEGLPLEFSRSPVGSLRIVGYREGGPLGDAISLLCLDGEGRIIKQVRPIKRNRAVALEASELSDLRDVVLGELGITITKELSDNWDAGYSRLRGSVLDELDQKDDRASLAALMAVPPVTPFQLGGPDGMGDIPDFTAATLRLAELQVGVRELPLGSNRGPEVDAYNLAVNAPARTPWCASFVGWCFQAAAVRSAPQAVPTSTSSVVLLRKWCGDKGLMREQGEIPQRGDLFFIEGESRGPYHTGFVTGVEEGASGYFLTVEGNSSESGGSNGVAVTARRRRLRSPGYRFARIKDLNRKSGYRSAAHQRPR